ncbi:MAG TPA: hypothetical protein VK324_03330 [Tepidisphaeraceae bacterium]|nr:hypothetical protein [Tepidisphaeraceae bacterium]
MAHPKATGYHWGYRQTGVSEDELAAHEATRSSILTFAWVTGLLASQSAFLIRHLAPRPPHPADGAPGRPSYLDR